MINTDDLYFYLLAAYGNSTKTKAKQYFQQVVDKYKPASGYVLNKTDSDWGVLRYMGNEAFIYGLNEKLNGNTTTLNAYSLASIEFLMGKNSKNLSFIVGFSSNSGKKPHHRNYYGSSANNMNGVTTQAGLEFGYLLGGRFDPAQFTDNIQTYTETEGGIDYNAGLVGALGYINSIKWLVNTGSFGHPAPDLGPDVSICGVASIKNTG